MGREKKFSKLNIIEAIDQLRKMSEYYFPKMAKLANEIVQN